VVLLSQAMTVSRRQSIYPDFATQCSIAKLKLGYLKDGENVETTGLHRLIE
jgi:hypothetical protein